MKRFTLIVSMLLALLYGCQDKRSGKSLLEAQKRYRQGSVREQALLRKAVIADPWLGEAWMQKSVAWNKRGDYAQGMALVNKAVEVDPVGYLGYRGYVKMYMLHDYYGAINDFYRLDSLTPGVRDAPWGEDIDHHIGLAYRQMGRHDSAIAALSRSVEAISRDQGPEWVNLWTYLYRGLSFQDAGMFEEARQDLEQALILYGSFMEGHFYLATLNLRQGKYQNAQKHLSRADSLFREGYLYRNAYYELPDQVYASDIQYCQEILNESLNEPVP